VFWVLSAFNKKSHVCWVSQCSHWTRLLRSHTDQNFQRAAYCCILQNGQGMAMDVP